ncbi:BQ5605_C025g09993 [Microbotryum silenes-dioicae]|uniref:Telomerase reverse transcriptase n=1 Tax=Microbotryum silenes-dioicae TaxID=796604 RepID=A0A2X0MQE4_9BASI|nr:BQ5605_C025g09993 [Microbotryum silenes-dioicae]
MSSRFPHPLPARPASPTSSAPPPTTLAASHAQARGPEPNRPPHRLLDVFYRTHRALANLLPLELILRAEDTSSYITFVKQTIVATCTVDERDDEGWRALQQLKHEAGDVVTVGMQEVLAQVHTRIFAQHAKKLAKNRQAPGTWTSSTPKNVLCLGHRPVCRPGMTISLTSLCALQIDITTSRPHDLTTSRSTCVPPMPSYGTEPPRFTWCRSTSTDWIRSGQETQPKIGTNAMIHLLASPDLAVFSLLPNGCLLQCSGTPLAELITLASRAAKGDVAKPSRKRKRSRAKSKFQSEPIDIDGPVPMDVDEVKATGFVTGPLPAAPDFVEPNRPSTAPMSRTASSMDVDDHNFDSNLATLKRKQNEGLARPVKRKKLPTLNSPSEIVIPRMRLYHARPNKDPKARLVYGLSNKRKRGLPYQGRLSSRREAEPFLPLDILTRLPAMFPPAAQQTKADAGQLLGGARHLAKYIFPRQFGLHNVFTYPKPRLNVEVVSDHHDREIEIKKLGTVKTPERVKPTLPMLQRMMLLHSRCNYRKMLDRYCPKKVTKEANLSQAERAVLLNLMSQPDTQSPHVEPSAKDHEEDEEDETPMAHGASQARARVRAKPRFTEYMCSTYEVICYVTAIVRDTIPRDFWGSKSNENLVLKHAGEFLRLRRFETMSLHTLLQGLCVADCDWLLPLSATRPRNRFQRAPSVEMAKRREVLMEFLYWFFDGFIVDLVRGDDLALQKTAFCVTDSATHDKKAIYFRHDDWSSICGPSLSSIRQTMFDSIPDEKAHVLLADRQLGFSFLRLLPKATGFRPIVNLARKPLITGPFGRKELGKTINKVLQASFDVLTFEKNRKPQLVGSLVGSPMDILERLKAYKIKMSKNGTQPLPTLYFVKVDVQGAYDSVKQEKLLSIVDKVLTESDYAVQKYAQVILQSRKPFRSWRRLACPEDDQDQFEHLAKKIAARTLEGVLSDQVVYQSITRPEVMKLLREHITANLVKFGTHFYKQKDGIPQGSVLSSLLCSLFYGDMEHKVLKFTNDPNSVGSGSENSTGFHQLSFGQYPIVQLLLRYVDDFLFITTQKPLAARFLRVMDRGIPEYGCKISPEKRLTNFDIALRPEEVVPPWRDPAFPWCGHTINTGNLDVRADTTRSSESDITNKLTVQRHSKPGESFLHSMMVQVKVRSYLLYLDTSHNTLYTVLLNIYQSMAIVAIKFVAYVREWKQARTRMRKDFFLGAVRGTVGYGWSLIRFRCGGKKAKKFGAEFGVGKNVVLWLSTQAFIHILSYQLNVWSWVVNELEADLILLPLTHEERSLVRSVATDEGNVFIEKTLQRTRRA